MDGDARREVAHGDVVQASAGPRHFVGQPPLERAVLGVRAEEAKPALREGAHVAGREQLRVADNQRRLALRERRPQRVETSERRLDGRDVLAVAVEALAAQRHRSIGRQPEAGVQLTLDRPLGRAPILDLRVVLLLLAVGAAETELGNVPVQLGDRDPEALKRPPSKQVEHLVQMLRERVERAAKAVVVELAGGDPKRLGDGEALAPIGKARERARMGEPIADQRLDHLAMRVLSDRADRAEAIDRLGQTEPIAEPFHDRQRPDRAHNQLPLPLHRRPTSTARNGSLPAMCGKRG